MADEIISNLPEAIVADDAQVLPVEDGVSTKKIKVGTIRTFFSKFFPNKDLSDLSTAGKNVFANPDLSNLSDAGTAKFVKRELFNGRTQISWTSIPAGTSGYVASKDLVIPNIPSWFKFGDNSFIELTLQVNSNTQNPTNNAQSKAIVTTSDIEAQKFVSNPNVGNSTEVIAGQAVATRHTFKLNVNKANPNFICYADNLGNGGFYHVYLDLVQAVAYQYPK